MFPLHFCHHARMKKWNCHFRFWRFANRFFLCALILLSLIVMVFLSDRLEIQLNAMYGTNSVILPPSFLSFFMSPKLAICGEFLVSLRDLSVVCLIHLSDIA